MRLDSPKAKVYLPAGSRSAERILEACSLEPDREVVEPDDPLESETYNTIRDALHEAGADIENFEVDAFQYTPERVIVYLALSDSGARWPECPEGHGEVRADGKCGVCGWDSAKPTKKGQS